LGNTQVGWEQRNNFKEITKLGLNFFNDLYSTPNRPNIVKILKLAYYFPRFIDQEGNEDLYT
jgi:hypothetical protein